MGNNNNKFLTALMEDGADAFKNMYDVYITYPGSDGGQVMTVRATGFDIPEAETETYDVKYKGTTYVKPKPSMTFQRQFNLTFRLDAAYNLMATFKAWHKMVTNPVTGGVSNIAAALGSVTVDALAQNYIADESTDKYGMKTWNSRENGSISGGVIKKWEFDSVWVKKVGQPKYATEDANHLTFQVDFVFGEFNETDYGDLDPRVSQQG